MRKYDVKSINKIKDKIPTFETIINDSEILEKEEKENLIFSLKYILHILMKYKGITKGRVI